MTSRAGSMNPFPGLRPFDQQCLEFAVFILRQVFLNEACEQSGFNETEHGLIIRLCRICQFVTVSS